LRRGSLAVLVLVVVEYGIGMYVIAPPGYTDPIQFGAGNPYGVHHRAGSGMPDDLTLQAARHQATRAGEVAAALKAGRATGHIDDGAQA
jgi:hypothetical protein